MWSEAVKEGNNSHNVIGLLFVVQKIKQSRQEDLCSLSVPCKA